MFESEKTIDVDMDFLRPLVSQSYPLRWGDKNSNNTGEGSC